MIALKGWRENEWRGRKQRGCVENDGEEGKEWRGEKGSSDYSFERMASKPYYVEFRYRVIL